MQNKHILKLESLDLKEDKANMIVRELEAFFKELGLEYEAIECRSRDGYIPHSWNRGGLEGRIFLQNVFMQNFNLSLFPTFEKSVNESIEYDRKYYIEQNGIEGELSDYDEMKLFDSLDEQSNVLLECHAVLNDENTLNIYFDLCSTDAPYFRKKDEFFEFTIEFSTIKDLKKELKTILKNDKVAKFTQIINF